MPPSLKGPDARDSYTKLPLLMMMTCASYAHDNGHKKQEAPPTKFNSLYGRRGWRFYRHISSRYRTYNGCKGQQQRQPDCQNAASHGSPTSFRSITPYRALPAEQAPIRRFLA